MLFDRSIGPSRGRVRLENAPRADLTARLPTERSDERRVAVLAPDYGDHSEAAVELTPGRLFSAFTDFGTLPNVHEVLGRYRLLSRIARGGMSETFVGERIEDWGFSQRVCLKRILAKDSVKADWIADFRKEVGIAARLRHQNIVALHDFDQDAGRWWMALELIEGATLRQLMNAYLRAGTPMPEMIVRYVAQELARALAYTHGHRQDESPSSCIVHRDVTPTNVLVSLHGAVKLADFGIATVMSNERTRTGQGMGKAAYAAPEHILGTTFDERADLFSLGVVLFELLAGTRPFDAPSPRQTVQNIVDGRKKELRALAPKTPERLVQIVETLLETKVDTRIQNAHELLKLLSDMPMRADVVLPLGDAVVRARAMAAAAASGVEIPEPGPLPTSAPAVVAPAPPVMLPSAGKDPLPVSPRVQRELSVRRVRVDGAEKIVAVDALQPGQQPNMERMLLWSAEGKEAVPTGRTERELVAAWGEPEKKGMKLWVWGDKEIA